jgi:hypothetical protein
VGPLTLFLLDEEEMSVESAMYLCTPNNKTLVNSNNKHISTITQNIKHSQNISNNITLVLSTKYFNNNNTNTSITTTKLVLQ